MAQLKKQFDCTAELYRIELCKMWGITYNSTYWVGNDVGGVLDIEGDLYLTFDEVRVIVENKTPRETVAEWQEYNVAVEVIREELRNINLRSWLMGYRHADAAALYEQLMDIKHGRN